VRSLAALVIVLLAACAQTLPEHDNRIFTAVPVAKLSAADLVQTFTTDQAAATERFAGKAIEVSGLVRDLPAESGTTKAFLLSAGDGPRHARVVLHEDHAARILPTMANGTRVTLRCFCEGVTDHVQLKSCVVPS
jgi:hypothetical protein